MNEQIICPNCGSSQVLLDRMVLIHGYSSGIDPHAGKTVPAQVTNGKIEYNIDPGFEFICQDWNDDSAGCGCRFTIRISLGKGRATLSMPSPFDPIRPKDVSELHIASSLQQR